MCEISRKIQFNKNYEPSVFVDHFSKFDTNVNNSLVYNSSNELTVYSRPRKKKVDRDIVMFNNKNNSIQVSRINDCFIELFLLVIRNFYQEIITSFYEKLIIFIENMINFSMTCSEKISRQIFNELENEYKKISGSFSEIKNFHFPYKSDKIKNLISAKLNLAFQHLNSYNVKTIYTEDNGVNVFKKEWKYKKEYIEAMFKDWTDEQLNKTCTPIQNNWLLGFCNMLGLTNGSNNDNVPRIGPSERLLLENDNVSRYQTNERLLLENNVSRYQNRRLLLENSV